MTTAGPVEWMVFWIVVALALAVDIGVARLGGRTPTRLNAALWSCAWIGLGLLFGAWVALRLGAEAGITYLTAYLVEESLSVDNLFLFVLIFAQTGVPAALQHRALFWGIAGALIMRAILIALGVYLLARFHWVIYPFAALLVFAGVRMLWGKEEETKLVEASCAICTSWVGRFIPITPVTTSASLLVRQRGRVLATPLLVALVVIEMSDLIFALDSIPAVFAVTRDPFLVYTSNIFALLGLRSLYFVRSYPRAAFSAGRTRHHAAIRRRKDALGRDHRDPSECVARRHRLHIRRRRRRVAVLSRSPGTALKSRLDVHNSYHSGVNRARLIAANGNADNQVIVTVASTGTLGGDTGSSTSPLAIAVTAAVRIDIDELVECVSNFGFGPPPIGLGQIVKVVLPK